MGLTPWGLVALEGCTFKHVEDVEAGDILDNGAIVLLKIVIKITDETVDLARIPEGPAVGYYHRVRFFDDYFIFPCDIFEPTTYHTDGMLLYDFILSGEDHIINVEGYDCICENYSYADYFEDIEDGVIEVEAKMSSTIFHNM